MAHMIKRYAVMTCVLEYLFDPLTRKSCFWKWQLKYQKERLWVICYNSFWGDVCTYCIASDFLSSHRKTKNRRHFNIQPWFTSDMVYFRHLVHIILIVYKITLLHIAHANAQSAIGQTPLLPWMPEGVSFYKPETTT